MNQQIQKLSAHLSDTVLGSEEAVFELLAAALAGGHVLIEGTPGVGKTTLVKTLAQSLDGQFRRVQFTPDLLPSDLLGYSLYRQDRSEFEFIEGPIFSNLLLADEINRTSPRIQSALLECMNESQVTVDGKSHCLPDFFQVVATQNNRYHTGTFPLPEPQLDRFLVSIEMSLPDSTTQSQMLRNHADRPLQENGSNGSNGALAGIKDLLSWRKKIQELPVSDSICDYIIRLCDAVRNRADLRGEISNRGSLALLQAARAMAAIQEHDGVFPEDVKRAFLPVITHRITLASEDPGSGQRERNRDKIGQILTKILETVEV